MGSFISALGTGLDIFGTLQAGKAQDLQSRIEQSFAERQARQEEFRGLDEIQIRGRQGERLESEQRAGFAHSGVRVDSGSPLLVMAETALDTIQDVKAIKEGTAAKAESYRERGRTFRGIGKAARTASRYRAGTSLLSGIGDVVRSNP